MNTKLVFSLALASSLPLLAVPRPDLTPNEAPAALPEAGDVDGDAGVPALGDPKKREVGFLGVAAMPVDAALADRLKIDHGVTLTRIVAKSPAAKADLAMDDIILEVGKKKIATMMDLSDAIKAHREGDKVTLKVIQKGKQVEKVVTLDAAPPLPPGFAAGGLMIMPGGGFGVPGGALQMGPGGGGQFRLGDEEGSVEMKGSGEGREVRVRDLAGELLFEGPWVSPQDKASAPPDIRKRIERVAGIFGGDDLPFRNFNVPAPRLFPPQIPAVPKLLPPFVPEDPLPALPPNGEPDEEAPQGAPEKDE